MARTCRGCGYHPIGPFTDNCPICAEPVRGGGGGRSRGGGGGGWADGGSSALNRWLLVGGLSALFAFAGCCGLGGWQGRRAAQDFEQEMERAKADAEVARRNRTVAVPAAQLLAEFQADPDAADRRYRGKWLEVSGVVERAGGDPDDAPFAVLHAGDDAARMRVECSFDAADDDEEARVRRLAKGRAVTVRGEFGGRVANVRLRDCVLVKE